MIWLLDLTWAGRVFRFASQPCTVGGVDYVGGLEPSFTLGAEPGAIQREVEVALGEVLFDIDVAEWQAQGRSVLESSAVLSTYRDGIKRARVSGAVEATEVGAFGEAVALTLRWTAPDGARIVPTAAQVSATPWPNADTAVYSRTYPRVFGRPGMGLAATNAANIAVTGGTQLTLVDPTPGNKHDWVLLVCDDHADAERADLLQVYGDKTGARETDVPLVKTQDSAGRNVTTIVPVSLAVERESTLWIDWTSAEKDDGTGTYIAAGATLRRDASGPIRSFGDLLYWLAGESDATFDTSAWRALPEALGGYEVGYYVDDDSSPLDIIENVCLPLLPLSVIPGADGLVPVVWRLDAAVADVALVEGDNVSRVSRLRTETRGVVTDIELAYAPRADDGQPYRVARADETTHPTCAESYSWLGRRRLRVETQAVYDATTADRIVGWWALSKGSIVERVRYEDWGGLDLEVGAVVSVTDADLSLTRRIGHVVEVKYTGDATEYVVAMYRLPGRDSLRA